MKNKRVIYPRFLCIRLTLFQILNIIYINETINIKVNISIFTTNLYFISYFKNGIDMILDYLNSFLNFNLLVSSIFLF